MKVLLFALALLCPSLLLAQDYDALVAEAVRLRNAGDLPAAEARLRQALPMAGDSSEVSLLLGMVLAFQERFQEGRELIEGALREHPDNLGLQLGRARILAFQGRFSEAAAAVQALRDRHGDDIETVNLAGRIALYQSQPRRAVELFDRVLAQEPDNLEALVGRHDATLALGETEAADTALARAAAVAPGHVDVVSRSNPANAPMARPHELSAGFSRGNFSQPGFSDWNDRFVEYRRHFANGDQRYVRSAHNHRFDRHDTQVEAGLLWHQDRAWPLELALGHTFDADFSADWFLRIGTRRQMHGLASELGALVLVPLYQFSSFGNGDTQRVQLGLEYYLPGLDAWLTPGIGMVRDQDGIETFAWSLGAHWQPAARHRIGASYSDAPETENLITTDTRNYALYWRTDLSDDWVLFLTASRLERVRSYERNEISIVLQHRF